jgi:hypothetical protein
MDQIVCYLITLQRLFRVERFKKWITLVELERLAEKVVMTYF